MSDIERIGQFNGEISKNVLEQQTKNHKTHYSKDVLKDLKMRKRHIDRVCNGKFRWHLYASRIELSR